MQWIVNVLHTPHLLSYDSVVSMHKYGLEYWGTRAYQAAGLPRRELVELAQKSVD